MTRMTLAAVAAIFLAAPAQAQYEQRAKLVTAEGKRVDKAIEYTLTFDRDVKPVNAMIALEWVREIVETDHTVTETKIVVRGKTAVVTCSMNGFPKSACYVGKLTFMSGDKDGARYEMELAGPYRKTKLDAFLSATARLDAQTRFLTEMETAKVGVSYAGDEAKGTVTLAFRR